jgi:uncharacterized protein
MNETPVLRYTCPKCGNKQYEVGEMWNFGNFWESLFKYHYRRYTYVACSKCHYMEFYKIPRRMIGEIYNFFAR